MNSQQQALFDQSIKVLDNNYAPPLLWGCPKLSVWYAVGLLHRNGPGDQERAALLVHNTLEMQDLDKNFPQNYGSFPNRIEQPLSSGPDPLWVSEIYDSYDPNNALFVTMAGIMIHKLYSDKLPKALMQRFVDAMHVAVRGNVPRKQGWYGDDLSPEYSNPFFMRAVCSAYIGNLVNDQELVDLSNTWTKQAAELWDKHDTPGEFNSPTYAGITLLALGLAQFCPNTEIAAVAPRLIKSTWVSLGETYNPSLRNVAGPWDRAYGYCMTRHYACIGGPLSAIIGDPKKYPMPYALDGAPHYTDIAGIPMQMLLSAYTESFLPSQTRDRLLTLTPHSYHAVSSFHPFDKIPRKYSFYIGGGLNVGGVSYDETRHGGPKGDITQFVPGTIQWDSGKHGGGVGWITVWPTAKCAEIIATESSLTIRLPPSVDGTSSDCKRIQLHIGCLPFFHLNRKDFQGEEQVLPGLTLQLSGNVAEKATRSLRYDKTTNLHGAKYYELVFDVSHIERPELVLGIRKTIPPENRLIV